MSDSSEIYYRGTDLDLVSPWSLEPLIAYFEKHDISTFNPFIDENGSWYANFLLATDEPHDGPDSHVSTMLNAIESMPAEARSCWDACIKRDFNPGYESGISPRSFSHQLSNETLRRIAECGATFTITIYPSGE